MFWNCFCFEILRLLFRFLDLGLGPELIPHVLPASSEGSGFSGSLKPCGSSQALWGSLVLHRDLGQQANDRAAWADGSSPSDVDPKPNTLHPAEGFEGFGFRAEGLSWDKPVRCKAPNTCSFSQSWVRFSFSSLRTPQQV